MLEIGMGRLRLPRKRMAGLIVVPAIIVELINEESSKLPLIGLRTAERRKPELRGRMGGLAG